MFAQQADRLPRLASAGVVPDDDCHERYLLTTDTNG
jgi:hypothetical protein